MPPHSTYLPPHLAAQFAHARTDFRPLRNIAAQEIERLIDFLDALDGDTDLEADADIEQDAGEMPEPEEDFEPNLCGLMVARPSPSDLEDEHDGREPDDEEDRADPEPDDSGLGDVDGLEEQFVRHSRHLARLAAITASEATDRRAPRLRLTVGGAA